MNEIDNWPFIILIVAIMLIGLLLLVPLNTITENIWSFVVGAMILGPIIFIILLFVIPLATIIIFTLIEKLIMVLAYGWLLVPIGIIAFMLLYHERENWAGGIVIIGIVVEILWYKFLERFNVGWNIEKFFERIHNWSDKFFWGEQRRYPGDRAIMKPANTRTLYDKHGNITGYIEKD